MKQVLIILILLFAEISCDKGVVLKKRNEKNLLDALNKINKDYCLYKDFTVEYFKNFNHFMECSYKNKSIYKKSCLRKKTMLYSLFVPKKLIKNKPFIFLRSWVGYECPPKTECTNEIEKRLILDPITYKVIETPASRTYKKACLKEKSKK